MKLARLLPAVAALCGLALAAPFAKADPLVFDLSASGSSSSQSLIGFANSLTVSTTTYLTSVAFDLSSTPGADVKYAIFNASNSLLATSSSFTVASGGAFAWYQEAFSYTLQPGNTYYIAYVQDAKVAGEQSAMGGTENGLSAQNYYDRAYTYYPAPRSAGSSGVTNFAVRLYGTQASVTPEPASLLLLGTGLLACGIVLRRRIAVL